MGTTKHEFYISSTLGVIAVFGDRRITGKTSPQTLETLIQTVDAAHPWKVNWRGGGPAPSIGKLTVEKCVDESRADKVSGEDVCFFKIEIEPSIPVGTHQLKAYHNYVSTLVKMMTRIMSDDTSLYPGVTVVCGQVVVATCETVHETLYSMMRQMRTPARPAATAG